MKQIVITALFALFLCNVSYAEETSSVLVLSLLKKVDDIVQSRVDLYADDINPNSSSINDQYRIEIDGYSVNVPGDFLASLDKNRRLYSYDTHSGGIVASLPPRAICLLGGSSVGYELQTRYLTYENHRIVHDEMKTVYSEAANCLFIRRVFPRKFSSEKAAAKAVAVLKTIAVLTQDQHGSDLNKVNPSSIPAS